MNKVKGLHIMNRVKGLHMISVVRTIMLGCIISLLAVACGSDGGDEVGSGGGGEGIVYSADGNEGAHAFAEMVAPDGSEIGTVKFDQGATGVLVTVDVSGLSPGAHGIHLHTVGACTPDFKAAGGHINPNEGLHGLLNTERSVDNRDNGDLPNLYAAADGTARAEFFTTLVTVSGGSMPELFDEDGSTVVIHENPDDHETQPIGGAGGRVGCGVIR